MGGGESNPEFGPPPGGDGVLIDELRGIRKFGRFLVKFWKSRPKISKKIVNFYNFHTVGEDLLGRRWFF